MAGRATRAKGNSARAEVRDAPSINRAGFDGRLCIGRYFETEGGVIIHPYHSIAMWSSRGEVVSFECVALMEGGEKLLCEYLHDGSSASRYGHVRRALTEAEQDAYRRVWIPRHEALLRR